MGQITYTVEQMDFILRNHKEMTVRQIADHLKIPTYVVSGIGYRYELEFKRHNRRVKYSPDPEEKLKHVVPNSLKPDPAPARITQRPPASYSNTGYLKTLETYNA